MEITIKPASSRKELVEIAALAARIWHQHYDRLLGTEQVDYMLERYQSEPALAAQLAEGYTYLSARDHSGTLVGYCGYHPEGDRLFLSKLYVAKEARGSGISRLFLNRLLEAARGMSAIYLPVNKHNESSIAVYRKFGFRTADAVTTAIGGGFVMDDYIMELPLR